MTLLTEQDGGGGTVEITANNEICRYHLDLEKRLSLLDGKVTALAVINAIALIMGFIAVMVKL